MQESFFTCVEDILLKFDEFFFFFAEIPFVTWEVRSSECFRRGRHLLKNMLAPVIVRVVSGIWITLLLHAVLLKRFLWWFSHHRT